MFPHEEYLMQAIQSCDYRMIGLVQDLGRVYVSAMAERPECANFRKVLLIEQALKKCANEIAEIQGDNPVVGGHCDTIVM